ncbi:MAG: HAD-IIIA family hydrolase [Bacteroidetes bacterium]|nr:MAG: HAD-IIIA family hydrolase [Bacteroidota bacterium]
MLKYNEDWTLFLDRDGVINKRLPGRYVGDIEEFEFLFNVPNAIAKFSQIFGQIIVITNQQGVGKKLMTEEQLGAVHQHMYEKVEMAGGQIDAVYFCPDLKTDANPCRKPSPIMGLWAQRDFPKINFKKSIMVGDSLSDILFGKALKMETVLVETNREEMKAVLEMEKNERNFQVDRKVSGLWELAELIENEF